MLGVEVELSRTRGVRDDGAGTARRGATWPTLPPAAILPRTLLRRTDTRLSPPRTNEPPPFPLYATRQANPPRFSFPSFRAPFLPVSSPYPLSSVADRHRLSLSGFELSRISKSKYDTLSIGMPGITL